MLRFYFVGDEDLLEMIGNSKDVPAISRHFIKMFAGIMVIKTSDQKRQEETKGKKKERIKTEITAKIEREESAEEGERFRLTHGGR